MLLKGAQEGGKNRHKEAQLVVLTFSMLPVLLGFPICQLLHLLPTRSDQMIMQLSRTASLVSESALLDIKFKWWFRLSQAVLRKAEPQVQPTLQTMLSNLISGEPSDSVHRGDYHHLIFEVAHLPFCCPLDQATKRCCVCRLMCLSFTCGNSNSVMTAIANIACCTLSPAWR